MCAQILANGTKVNRMLCAKAGYRRRTVDADIASAATHARTRARALSRHVYSFPSQNRGISVEVLSPHYSPRRLRNQHTPSSCSLTPVYNKKQRQEQKRCQIRTVTEVDLEIQLPGPQKHGGWSKTSASRSCIFLNFRSQEKKKKQRD